MVIKYPKSLQNIPNGHKIQTFFQAKALQNLPKLGFFGLKVNRLATLVINCKVFNVFR
jgi:hypothetical protein